jgi:hypothetical protein
MTATNYLEYSLCDHATGKTSYTKPTTVYLAALTSDAGETGSVTGEPSGNGYARQAITSSFGAANVTTGTATNSGGAITFGPNTTSNWGTMAYGLYCDASSAGNGMIYFTFTSSRAIAVGDSLQFATSTLSVVFD